MNIPAGGAVRHWPDSRQAKTAVGSIPTWYMPAFPAANRYLPESCAPPSNALLLVFFILVVLVAAHAQRHSCASKGANNIASEYPRTNLIYSDELAAQGPE
jgi:hypothetical protein